jgi:hypothetical protein
VLDGIVQSWTVESGKDSILTVQVDRYLKGSGPKTVRISGYFYFCGMYFMFHEGSRSIFFANGDPASTQPLRVQSWFDAQDAVITTIRNSTGQEPVAPDGTYDVLWLGLLAIVVVGLIMFMRQRRAQS